MKLSYSNEKDGGLSFETQWKIGFYHQKTVVKNAWKCPCLGEIPELHTCGYGHSQLIVWFVSVLSLTLPGLGFFENLRGLRGGPSRPVVKKHERFCPFYMKLCTYTVLTIWNKSWKQIVKCHFCHHLMMSLWKSQLPWWQHVLTFFKFFRNLCIYFFFSQMELRRKCCIFYVSRFLINSQ